MEWKKGPMPVGTWGWGGVVPVDGPQSGFFFADFKGDTVEQIPGGRVLKANEVAWYNNGLTLPPGVTTGRAT